MSFNNSPSSPGPPPAPLSIKERMAALKGAGMDAVSVYSKPEPAAPLRTKEDISSSSPRAVGINKELSESTPPSRLRPAMSTPPIAPKPVPIPTSYTTTTPNPPPASAAIEPEPPAQNQPQPQPPIRPSAPASSLSSIQEPTNDVQSQAITQFSPSSVSSAAVPQSQSPDSSAPSPSTSTLIQPSEPPLPAPKPTRTITQTPSQPSSRHSSPPPISAKPSSLANYTPPSRSGEFTPTAPSYQPTVSHSAPQTPVLELDEPKDFSSHFPSLTEFERLPELRERDTSTMTTGGREGSRALPSVPTHLPGTGFDTSPSLSSSRQSTITSHPSASDSHTPSISPNHTAASINSLASSSSSYQSTNLQYHPPSSSPHLPIHLHQSKTSPNSLPSSLNGLSLSSNGIHSSPNASSSSPTTSSTLKSLDYPFAIQITPPELARYLSDPRSKLLILDVRPLVAFQAGHIQDDRTRTIHVDPSWLEDYNPTGSTLAPQLASEVEREAFEARNTLDLVVILQSSLASDGAPKGTTPAEKLAQALYEREFGSKSLKRSPVLLVGGWEGWLVWESRGQAKERDAPGAGLGLMANEAGGADGHASNGIDLDKPLAPMSASREFQSRPLPRTTRLPPRGGQGLPDLIELDSPAKPAASSSSATMTNGSPYPSHIQMSLSRPLPPSPQPGQHQYGHHQSSASLSHTYQLSHLYSHHNLHQPSPSLSYPYPSTSASSTSTSSNINQPSPYYTASLPSPPPSASISRTPLSRRRSDYADQASQPYSGYSVHHQKGRPSIDYPNLTPGAYDGGASGSGSGAFATAAAAALGQQSSPYGSSISLGTVGQSGVAGSVTGAGGIPQPPPVAATPSLERHNSRSSLVRSSSITLPSGKEVDEVTYWGNEIVGMSGLKNLGNTCYQNSTLQCLSATAPFSKLFIDGRWKRSVNTTNPLGTKGNLASAYSSLVTALWRQEYDFIQPLSFRKSIVKFAPSFDGNEQHDSQEFLAFLLDGLHEDLNRIQVRPPSLPMTAEREAELNTLPTAVAGAKEWKAYQTRNDSLVVDWFQGQYRSRVECTSCHQTSTTFDSFMYLSLPVPTSRLKSRISLNQCLDQFTAEEVMEKGNAWNCPSCKKPRTATKSLQLSRLPPVLLIHLKRFSSKNGVFWDKAETLVEFPVRGLDLTKYLPSSGGSLEVTKFQDDPRVQKPPFMYELYAVSNHMGSLSSGHYTAYVKSSQRGWKYCDDRTISEAQERDVMTKNAYILFYRRVPSIPSF